MKRVVLSWVIGIALIASSVVLIGSTTNKLAEHVAEPVDLEIFGCPIDAGERAAVVSDGKTIGLVRIHSQKPVPERFQIAPGRHVLEVTSRHCRYSAPFSVIAAHGRSITVVLSSGQVVSIGASSLVGVVSGAGAQVSLFRCGGIEREITFEGGAYYAERLLPGSYLLRVSFAESSVQLRLPVTVRPGANRFDVTTDTIARNVGSTYTVDGSNLVFHPLWGSVTQEGCKIAGSF